MDVSSAMQWWEEWQLRFLVLGSLFMHMFLAYAERLRRKPKLRAFLWLAYVGSDALSIYALATLFGRQKKLAVDGGSRGLEVIWAPILLVHLSGQWTVTAYSLEDNELWRRHVLTLMTQVTIALYVFCKWWSGGGKLLAAAVLQFIVGIVRFAQKPWLLRRASFNALKADSSLPRPRKGGIVASLWTWCTIDMYEFEEAKKVGWRERQERESLHKYVEEASKSVLLATQTETADDEDVLENLGSAIGHTNYFVDVIAPYSARLRELQNFIKLDCPSGNKTINNYIHTKYLAMYSGLRAANSPLSGILRQYLLPSLSLASVVLFARSHKDGYSVNDIWVTYIVFCYAAVQEFFPWLGIIHFCFCILTRPKCMGPLGAGWRMVPQYNLLSYCAHKKKPTILMKLATFSFLRELVSKHACIQEVDSWSGIIWTVFSYTKFGWTEYIRGDVARYKRFNNFRGQLALSRHGLMERIGWSVSMRFDESVLVWHIATDLCVYCLDTSPQGEEAARVSKDISSYMMYLFSIHPEMLIPGARSAFFYLAIEDIELLLKDSEVKLDKEKILAREILKARKTEDTRIHDACKLVEALMELDEEERWTVIGKVWVELLCYSTSRCRGYLHAKGLGEGGLFGTWIWVMWSFMGMETWVERYHRLEDPEEGGGMGQKGEEGRAGAAEEGQQQDGGAQAPGHPQEPHILVPLSSIEISIA